MGHRPQGKHFRLRASRLDKEGEGLFCLPLGFRDALLDACERFEWAATWLDDQGDRIELTETQKSQVELGILRLVDMCEIVINNYVDVSVPPGGGCQPINILPVPVGNDGEDIVTTPVPLNPLDPFDDEEPVFDDTAGVPPEGWPDYQTFVDDRCLMANYYVDQLFITIGLMDELENKASVASDAGSLLIDIAWLIMLFVPLPVGKLKGVATFAQWVARILKAIDVFSEGIEPINDYLQLIGDELEPYRDEIKCVVYTALNGDQGKAYAIAKLSPAIDDALAGLGLSPAQIDALRQIYLGVVGDLVPLAYSYAARFLVPEGYVAPYDCTNCQPGLYTFLPVQIDTFHGFDYSGGVHGGGSAGSYELLSPNAIDISFDADREGTQAWLTMQFADPGLQGARIIGIRYRAIPLSLVHPALGVSMADTDDHVPPTTGGALWNAGIRTVWPGWSHYLVTAASAFGDQYQSLNVLPGDYFERLELINVNDCNIGPKWVGLGAHSAGPGRVGIRFQQIEWIISWQSTC